MKEDPANNFFQKMDEFIDSIDLFDVTKLLPGLNKPESFDGLLFKFPATITYGSLNDVGFPQTLTQQEDQSFNNMHFLTAWTERSVNGTYPYPGADGVNGLIGKSLANIEQVNGELVNKPNNHQSTSELDEPASIFDTYRVYNL